MDLQQYLSRIHFSGSPGVDLETLSQIHRQHLLHIPYENLDVQLGRPLDFDIERIFDKLVHQQRGGWCYEMNGLLEWVLREIGFDVTRMSGAVMRAELGDVQLGNHLVLEVTLDQPYLADLGLGDGIREPIPLREGRYQQGHLQYGLEPIADNYWRFHNHEYSNVASFDFKHEPADEKVLADKCAWLQTAAESPFKMLFIAQIFTPQGIVMQLGKMFTTITDNGKTTAEIDDLDTFNSHMAATFGLVEDFHELWPAILSAHDRFFGHEAGNR